MHYVDEKLQTWLLAVMHYVFIYKWLNGECNLVHCAKWRILETVAL